MFGNIPNYDPLAGDALPLNDNAAAANRRPPPPTDRSDPTLDDANRVAL